MKRRNVITASLYLLLFSFLLTGIFSCKKDGGDDEDLKDPYVEFTVDGVMQRYNNCAIVKTTVAGGFNRYIISAQQAGSTAGRNSLAIEINLNEPNREIEPSQLSSANASIRFSYTDGTGAMFNSAGTTPTPFLTVTDAGSKFVEVSNFSSRVASGATTKTLSGSLYARAAQ